MKSNINVLGAGMMKFDKSATAFMVTHHFFREHVFG